MSVELRPCRQGWAFCDGNCEKCSTTATTTTDGYWYHGNGKIGGEFHPTKPNDEERYGEYVKIVRCKNCKYRYGDKDEPYCSRINPYSGMCVEDTGACVNPAHRTFSFTSYDPIEIARQYAPKFDKPVVDMVEVVRCKDCVYYTPEVDDPHKSTCQRLWGGMTECNADSYCSDGVRKDEVENG